MKRAATFYTNQAVEKYAAVTTNKVTMKQLLAFGRNINERKILKSANLVRDELVTRLAHRILDFQKLPFIVGTNPRIEHAYSRYCDAFDSLRKLPPIDTLSSNTSFCQLLRSLLKEHMTVIPSLSGGMMECSRFVPPIQMDQFMNNMLRTRIGRRVLAEQHISLSDEYVKNGSQFDRHLKVGIVDNTCRVEQFMKKCSKLASDAIKKELNIDKVPHITSEGDHTASFMYIPDHIEYIMFEILKNALRYQIMNAKENEPVVVLSKESSGSITFRVSDQGGGFDKKVLPQDFPSKLWSFSHQYNVSDPENGLRRYNESTEFKLAGKVNDPENCRFKLGLQLSRIFANYWGGEVQVCTMYGYGTDVYVRLNTTGEETENLTIETAE